MLFYSFKSTPAQFDQHNHVFLANMMVFSKTELCVFQGHPVTLSEVRIQACVQKLCAVYVEHY